MKRTTDKIHTNYVKLSVYIVGMQAFVYDMIGLYEHDEYYSIKLSIYLYI